jgi:hypothetical protein
MGTLKITFAQLEKMGFESVTDYCRALMKEPDPYGVFPETKIEVYRGDMLCLTVSSVEYGATQEPRSDGWQKYTGKRHSKGVLMRLNDQGATHIA